ncbi:hypothetical protein BG015_008754 [Linnemannia schmuckeri]|uniref:Uncharacterized protein n=1 Tax=Linnemannia schmuckeri TaxID=64567 RepID=A0A9P5RWG7_9FUNG|nr:hypothetical protein BG015_008754 [Linnemannia schmuckeri]
MYPHPLALPEILPDLFQFQYCTRLRELKVSEYVYLGWTIQLIKANPNLALLDWFYPDEVELGRHRCESSLTKKFDFSKNLLCITGLRKLRFLRSEKWSIEILYLYNVPDKLADSLEELNLAEYCNLEIEEEAGEAVAPTPKRPLFLPKFKTLHTDIHWKRSDLEPIYDMMQAFLPLETLIIQPNSMLDFEKLQLILRDAMHNEPAIMPYDVVIDLLSNSDFTYLGIDAHIVKKNSTHF